MNTLEKLLIKSNDFQNNITSQFRSLREDTDFNDVTLVCEDGQQVEAHKVILVASSPIFQIILKKYQHPHPLIYMRGVKLDDLVAIVDFLYHGEVNVYQANLDSFLVLAEELKLKGLAKVQQEKTKNESENLRLDAFESEGYSSMFQSYTSKTAKKINTKIEQVKFTENVIAFKDQKVLVDIQDLDEKIKSMMILGETVTAGNRQEKLRICAVCGKEGTKSTIISHIEANHITGNFNTCNICGKTFRSRLSMKNYNYNFYIFFFFRARHNLRIHKRVHI